MATPCIAHHPWPKSLCEGPEVGAYLCSYVCRHISVAFLCGSSVDSLWIPMKAFVSWQASNKVHSHGKPQVPGCCTNIYHVGRGTTCCSTPILPTMAVPSPVSIPNPVLVYTIGLDVEGSGTQCCLHHRPGPCMVLQPSCLRPFVFQQLSSPDCLYIRHTPTTSSTLGVAPVWVVR